jgi:hypothetical protein
MKTSLKTILLGGLLLWANHVFTAQPATTLLDVELKNEPFLDAENTGSIPANTLVEIRQRKGGWYQIHLPPDTTGWVRMTTLRLKGRDMRPATETTGTGREGVTQVGAATGIRGLDADDVTNAAPDLAAVDRLDELRAVDAEIQQFADSAPLLSHEQAYLVDMPELSTPPPETSKQEESE